jgi:hypothetical protein
VYCSACGLALGEAPPPSTAPAAVNRTGVTTLQAAAIFLLLALACSMAALLLSKAESGWDPQVGESWTYVVRESSGKGSPMEFAVTERRMEGEDVVLLFNASRSGAVDDKKLEIRIRQDGLHFFEKDPDGKDSDKVLGHFLRYPFEAGATWQSLPLDNPAMLSIVAQGTEVVDVGAGSFLCHRLEAAAREAGWIYKYWVCPEVGLVKMEGFQGSKLKGSLELQAHRPGTN